MSDSCVVPGLLYSSFVLLYLITMSAVIRALMYPLAQAPWRSITMWQPSRS